MTRIDRLRERLEPGESLLVTHLVNVRYLTGFSGSHAIAVISPDRALLVTDSRYTLQAQAECHDVEIHTAADVLAIAVAAVPEGLAVEGDHMTMTQYSRITTTHNGAVRQTRGMVEGLRTVKDASEVAAIREAGAIATAALAQTVAGIRVGMTERDIAVLLERTMVDLGAQDRAFDTIVATGPNSAIPHHQPTSRPLQRGDLLKIDFGALVRGYHSDCTRTFCIGPAHAWQEETYEQVLAAQCAGLATIRDGVAVSTVDNAARTAMSDHAGNFQHGLGHGVGLEIHEDPFVRSTSTDRLATNVVMTVEPGRYLPDHGGVRIEDTILVTPDGHESLTVFPRELTDIT